MLCKKRNINTYIVDILRFSLLSLSKDKTYLYIKTHNYEYIIFIKTKNNHKKL